MKFSVALHPEVSRKRTLFFIFPFQLAVSNNTKKPNTAKLTCKGLQAFPQTGNKKDLPYDRPKDVRYQPLQT